MTKIMIPKCRNPFVVIMNGIRYEYESGKEVEVPDEVAEVIQFHEDSKPKALPIIGGSGPCGLPHVYFSDSAGKLPTDAVDGSLAVVTEVLEGTKWVLNDEIGDLSDELNITLTVGGLDHLFTSVFKGQYGPPVYAMKYRFETGSQSVYIFAQENMYGQTAGWINESYKEIDVYKADETARAWLEANGNNTGEECEYVIPPHLYSRENGEWVSKGEVDFTDLAST